MPADHARRTITGADERKGDEMKEMNVEKWWNEICGRGKQEKSRQNLPILRYVQNKTHMK